ncbi:MAG: DUF2785 domain-containing protein [Kofleriaceae bacterium]
MIKHVALVILVLVGCSQTPSPQGPATRVEQERAVIPARDEAMQRWQAIIADEFRVPAGTTAAALVPELVAYLGSPDPARRDGIGYEVLATWIDKRVLADAEVAALAQQLITGTRDANVLRRSFSLLVLSVVVRRDAATPALTDDLRRAILAAAHTHAQRETDLRGHVGAQGWIHAAAHAADLLAQLAKLTLFGETERATMLDAVAGFTSRRHGHILAYGEDGRLAAAVLAAVKRGVAKPALEAWLQKVVAPLKERNTPVFDAPKFAAQRNARNLMFTLFVQVSLTAEPTAGERELLETLRALLAG